MITQTLDLNLIPGRVLPMVNVSQYDKDSRTLEFTIYNGDQTFDLTGLSAYIQGLKPDGHGFNYPATVSAGKITADVTEQMTAVSGRVMCEIIVMSGTDRIGTGNFILNVEAAAMPDGSNMSESDYSYIEQLIEDAQEAVTDAEAWAVGEKGGVPVPATDPTYQNNSKYYSEVAQQYAQGGLHYMGSVLFANIPTTGLNEGDMYNIEDDFVTDSRFQEGAGISVAAGSNIAYNANNKWDVLAVAMVADMTGATASTPGTHGLVPAPAAGDEDKVLKGDGTWGDLPGDMTGATAGQAGTHGLVPAPAAGDQDKFLKGDGTWGTIAAAGHAIWNKLKTLMTTRPVLWFKDANVTDDAVNESTNIEVIQTISETDFDALANTADGLYNIDDGSAVPLNTKMVAFDNTGTDLSATTSDGAIKELDELCKTLHVSASSVSSLPVTISNANITSDMRVIEWVLSNPSAQTGDWSWTTAAGGVTITGTISGTTKIDLDLLGGR